MKELFSTGSGILGTSFDIDGSPRRKKWHRVNLTKPASHISLPFFQRFVDLRFGKSRIGSARNKSLGPKD
jgi:hypothetical protein